MGPETYSHRLFASADSFLLEMLTLGKPLETSLVGVFDHEAGVRGSRRDIELPLHRDGEYSALHGVATLDVQEIAFIGFYCIQEGEEPCWTLVEHPETQSVEEINLKKGEALIINNRAIRHGRRGPVGRRLLLRVWTTNWSRSAG